MTATRGERRLKYGKRATHESERKLKRRNIRYNGDASVKDVGLWSVYCMYYTVSREDMKPCGLCPVKMMSYAVRFFFLSAFVCSKTGKLFFELKKSKVHQWKATDIITHKMLHMFSLFIPCICLLSLFRVKFWC